LSITNNLFFKKHIILVIIEWIGDEYMKNLKMLREEKGISQQGLADQLGTHQQSIHGYENGLHEPDIETLKLLADFFNTSIDFLVGNTDVIHKIEPVERFDLNENEGALIEKYRKLNGNAQNSIMTMIDTLLEK